MGTSDNTFLALPGEIRNHIYDLLLTVPPPLDCQTLGRVRPIYPEILSVCQQTYREGIQILYGCNTYIAHYSLLSGAPQLRRWLKPIHAPRLTSMIRRYYIYVRLDCDARFTADKAQEAFTGMEELTIEVFQSQYRGSDHSVLKLFEEIRGVKRARVYGSITAFPEYAKWLEHVMMSPKGAKLLDMIESDVGAFDLWTEGGR